METTIAAARVGIGREHETGRRDREASATGDDVAPAPSAPRGTTTAGRLPAPVAQRRSLQALAGVIAGATIAGIELFAAIGYQEAMGPQRDRQLVLLLGVHLVLTVLWGPLIGVAVGAAPSRRKVRSGAIIATGVTCFVLALAVGSPWGSLGVPSVADLSWADRLVGVLRPASIVPAGSVLALGAMTGMAIGALQTLCLKGLDWRPFARGS